MRKWSFACVLVALASSGGVGAQDNEGDYATQFGGEATSDEGQPGPREAGPRDITEAKQQGRAYRLGSAAGPRMSTTGGKDLHVVQQGDTLWDISAHYYGDPWHWPEIWSYNPEITNPHWIYPLDQIRLSPNALTDEQANARLASVTNGGPSTALPQKANAGMLAGTEIAPPVVVPGDVWKPGMIFLRDSGYLDDEALRNAGQIIGGNEEHMLLSTSDQIYVRFDGDVAPTTGDSYTVLRELKPKERTEHEKGRLVKVLGLIAIRSYDRDKHVARGVLTEALDPVERGMMVAKIDRRFDLVMPKQNTASVVAHIVASVQPYTLLGYGNVVFLDVGEGHGIEPGNRFFVVRRGDPWLKDLRAKPTELGNITEVPRYDPMILPKEVIAELRVIKVRKTTTVALITRSDIDVAIGDAAEMRAGF